MTNIEMVLCVAFGVFIGHWTYAISDTVISEFIKGEDEDPWD